jgi:hypothetical protein
MAPDIAYFAPVLTAQDAISRHIQWKIALQLAINLLEPPSADAIHVIRHSEACPVGKWLLSRHTLEVRDTPEYKALVERHDKFHRETMVIANLINRETSTGRSGDSVPGAATAGPRTPSPVPSPPSTGSRGSGSRP